MIKRVMAAGVVPALLLAALCAGCGSDGGSDGGGAAPTSPALQGQKATGTPIKVGVINQDGGSSPRPDVRAAMRAAFRYVNDELGGVDNHPLEATYCSAQGTPESSSACANEILDAKPAFVLVGADTTSAASVPIISGAGIPYVTSFPTSLQEMSCDTCFAWTGGTQEIGSSVIEDLKAKDFTKAATIYVDVPAAKLPAEAFAKAAAADGIDVRLVPLSATNPDASGALAAAAKGGTQGILALNSSAGCSSIMKNAKALAVMAKLYFYAGCSDPQTLENGGGGAEGGLFTSDYESFDDGSNRDVARFLAKMKQFEPKTPIAFYSQTGFSAVMTTYAALQGVDESSLTPQGLLAHLRAAKGVPVFMGINGKKATCDHTALPSLPAICSVEGGILQYHDGLFVKSS